MPLSFLLIILYTLKAQLQVTGSQLSRGKASVFTAKMQSLQRFAEKCCKVQIKNRQPPAVNKCGPAAESLCCYVLAIPSTLSTTPVI